MIKNILQYRDLMLMLTMRDIRIRYKQAAMGFLWAIFMPIVAVLAGVVIKKAMSVVSGKPMDLEGILTISVKVLPWTFFVSALRFAVQSLIGNSNLVTKIYFPRAVLPFSAILACMFDFGIAISILTLFLCFMNIGASIYLLWLPLIAVCLILFTSGLGILLASANLFFRDVKYIVEVILTFGIFFTPVLYDASMVGSWGKYILLNPMASILEAINSVVVLKQMPDLFWLGYAALSSVGIFIFGLFIFNKQEPYFAESI